MCMNIRYYIFIYIMFVGIQFYAKKICYYLYDMYKIYTKYVNNKENNTKIKNLDLYYENNIVEELDDDDNRLLDEVNKFVKKHGNEDYPLCSGILHNSGKILYGLAAKCPMGYDVHGEHALMSQARIHDKDKSNYISMVSMTYTGNMKVKAPCGICRELLRYHYPNLCIIVPHPITGKFVKITSKNLLPYPYVSTKLPDDAKLEKNVELVTIAE